jgi:L-ascorbate metabolism protein UlaG (beta-lactamase superfamily)
VIVTHLGHSCLLVEAGGVRLLIDPGSFTPGFEELTDLDAIVITHQHIDHVDPERILPLVAGNPGATVHAEPQAAQQLADRGVAVTPLAPDDVVALGSLTVSGGGGQHAVIHPEIPRVGNTGITLAGEGEPTLFHPGDSLAHVPPGVDVLALPLSAPWSKFSETADFARAVAAPRLFPIHDAVLSPPGRGVYLTNLRNLLPEGSTVLDLPGAGATAL